MTVLIDKHRGRAALRLATLPDTHPLYKQVRRAARRRVKRHMAPLHELMHDFDINPAIMETIRPARFPPGWQPNLSVAIAKSREEAVEMDTADSAAVQIYTDGSGKDGATGASAVLYKNGTRKRSLRMKLGSDKDHTVPEAEGVGLILALELLRGENRVGRATIAADNLAAITRTASDQSAPSQYLWDMFHARWGMVQKKHKGIKLTIRWVPGHEGVTGNEEADRLAKKAIEVGSSRQSKLPAPLRSGLPRSRAAAQRALQEGLKKRAERVWKTSPRYGKLKEADETIPSKKFLRLTEGLPRKKASILIQLRTGHVPLQAHLYRIKKADSPICAQCKTGHETVHHYLMVCRAFTEQRRRMQRDGGREASIMAKLMSKEKLIPVLFRYIAQTKRFAITFGDINTPE
jgi:ribonuclease HI